MSKLKSPMHKMTRNEAREFTIHQLIGARMLIEFEAETRAIFINFSAFYKKSVQEFSEKSVVVLMDSNDCPIGLIDRCGRSKEEPSSAVCMYELGRIVSPFVPADQLLQSFNKVQDRTSWEKCWSNIA